jgi:hypothetical protein
MIEDGMYADREKAIQFITERTRDYIYYQLHDILSQIKYYCHSYDEQTFAILDQLQSDFKYILTLPHLERCSFIQEHMIIMLESVVPAQDGYARHHLTWHINQLKLTVGYEVIWKGKQAA